MHAFETFLGGGILLLLLELLMIAVVAYKNEAGKTSSTEIAADAEFSEPVGEENEGKAFFEQEHVEQQPCPQDKEKVDYLARKCRVPYDKDAGVCACEQQLTEVTFQGNKQQKCRWGCKELKSDTFGCFGNQYSGVVECTSTEKTQKAAEDLPESTT
ncbi:unnamed protein product [Amoebophrya sp. A120]|nr:unnamed protein product [Amoebophrya sp. A120]CAD7927400.1 unnamed protein product [Amoebophrya sp. A120]|eukprot:GSA120T00004935001.1